MQTSTYCNTSHPVHTSTDCSISTSIPINQESFKDKSLCENLSESNNNLSQRRFFSTSLKGKGLNLLDVDNYAENGLTDGSLIGPMSIHVSFSMQKMEDPI